MLLVTPGRFFLPVFPPFPRFFEMGVWGPRNNSCLTTFSDACCTADFEAMSTSEAPSFSVSESSSTDWSIVSCGVSSWFVGGGWGEGVG